MTRPLIPSTSLDCWDEQHEECPDIGSGFMDRGDLCFCGCTCHDAANELSAYLTGQSDVLPPMTPYIREE